MSIDLFYGVADIYDKYRPTYPKEFLDFLHSHVGINQKSIIADIGSGTGILTRQLLKIGGTVFAIEPNSDMKRVSDSNLSSYKNYKSICATAENTKLLNNQIDFITVAQAFHWFDRVNFKQECKRILKHNGKIILIWNVRDESNEVVNSIDEIAQKYNAEFKNSKKLIRGARTDTEYNDFFESPYETYVFSNPQYFDKERFLGLHKTASYCPKHKNEAYLNYIIDLSDFFDRNNQNGQLLLQNNTVCYIGCL